MYVYLFIIYLFTYLLFIYLLFYIILFIYYFILFTYLLFLYIFIFIFISIFIYIYFYLRVLLKGIYIFAYLGIHATLDCPSNSKLIISGQTGKSVLINVSNTAQHILGLTPVNAMLRIFL